MEPFDINKMTDVQLHILKKTIGDAKEALLAVFEQYKVTALDQLTAPQAYEVILKVQDSNREKRAAENAALQKAVEDKINKKLGTKELPSKFKVLVG